MTPLSSLYRFALVGGALAFVLVGCDDDPYFGNTPLTPLGNAIAYGLWTPGPNDTCTKADHDRYSVVGPDRKLYPAWHPPVDPVTGCTFGHEHGRDPRGSRLYAQVGDIPLGYANEQLETWDPTGVRREDHFGHKIEWENDVRLDFDSDAADQLFDVRCDFLTKLHQGTHSKDAFTNNLHELVYHVRCTDGGEMHITIMAAIGTPGEFERSCDRATIAVGPATPANSPNGGGVRIIADRYCVEQEILVPPGQRSDFGVLHENWEVSQSIRTTSGHTLAHFNPYYQVFLPSRFHDPALTDLTGRPISVCYEVTGTGERASGGACDRSTDTGTVAGLLFDDPRSEFNGVRRQVDINDNIIDNERGPVFWFTDPFGHRARPDSFPGAIRQYISRVNTTRGGLGTSGPVMGGDRRYGGTGTHAPN
jgi:hypothetical protein